eukprot:TRINITY_DN835_c0_g1_i1.p1 TRINITY_DN835_c0_g1~~TRINITY_DN835_c0_g1_i1.p1  ORF type:complete len:190 (-),score=48.27 TRINITY_DN835_c0_g1_i1:94-663(-)
MATDYKLCIIGSGGVGKSALVVQFCKNKFIERFDPTIEDAYRQQTEVDGEAHMLEIYDTAGQEEFSSLRDTYIKASEGFLVTYSVNTKRSFNQAQQLVTTVKSMKGDDIPILLIGNKCDLPEREVPENEAYDYAVQNSIGFLETSAKTNTNVKECFHSLIRRVKKYRETKEKITPKTETGKKNKKCIMF